jgi:hypothetical protein
MADLESVLELNAGAAEEMPVRPDLVVQERRVAADEGPVLSEGAMRGAAKKRA